MKNVKIFFRRRAVRHEAQASAAPHAKRRSSNLYTLGIEKKGIEEAFDNSDYV